MEFLFELVMLNFVKNLKLQKADCSCFAGWIKIKSEICNR